MTDETTTEPEGNPNDEAARFRRRLRDTEADRDRLAASVESLQRQRVEQILADTNVTPAALWKVTDVGHLVDDDGTVDPDKVAAAITSARDQFGITPTPKGNYVPGVGNQPAGMPKGDLFTEAFRPQRR